MEAHPDALNTTEKFVERIFAHRERMKKAVLFHAPQHRGLGRKLTLLHADFVRRLIRDMVRAATQAQQDPDLRRRLDTEVAVALTGGSGRGDAGPHSDIDIAIILNTDGDWLAPFMQTFSTLMHEVGEKTKTDFSCLFRPTNEFKQLDHDSQTALLDMELVAGSKHAFRAMRRRVLREIEILSFSDSRYRQYRQNHKRWRDTPYNLEPDIKNGPGGLRDFNYALWISQVVLGVSRNEIYGELVKRGIVRPQYLRNAKKAMDFLLAVRFLMHLRAGQENNVFPRTAQQGLAETLGYKNLETVSAWEQFMDEYYHHAGILYRTSRHILDGMKDCPKKLEKGLVVVRKTIDAAEGLSLDKDPQIIMRLFSYVAQYGLSISGSLYAKLEDANWLVDDRFREDPVVGRIFLDIFRKPYTLMALRRMMVCGIAEAYLPELRGMHVRVPREAPHILTIGEHSLRTLTILDRIRLGHDLDDIGYPRQDDGRALPLSIYDQVDGKRFLGFAVWLHDIGKLPNPAEHSTAGADMVAAILRRMGVREDRVADADFLVRHHLSMPALSRKYQLEEAIVERLATICKTSNVEDSLNRLNSLYLLSLCDSIATNPFNWDSISRVRLDDLYRETKNYLLHGGLEGEEAERREKAILDIGRVARFVKDETITPDQVRDHCNRMPLSYLNFPREAVVKHISMVRQVSEGEKLVVDLGRFQDVGFSVLTICLPDPGPGLLAKISGALYAAGVDIHDAEIYSRQGEPKVALDVLKITYADGPVVYDSDAERILRILKEVLLGTVSVEEELKRRNKSLPTTAMQLVAVDNDLSNRFTVVEVNTTDDKGVLYLLSTFFGNRGFDIHYARVSPWTHGTCDVFYISKKGKRIEDEKGLKMELMSYAMRE